METVMQVLRDEPVPPRRLNRVDPSRSRDNLSEVSGEGTGRALRQRRGPCGRPAPIPDRRAHRGAAGHAARARGQLARRKPTLAAAYLLGLLAALLGGLGGTALWQWRAAERAREAARSPNLKPSGRETGRTRRENRADRTQPGSEGPG